MIKRLFSPLNSNSYFIFGARGTGKSTWLLEQFDKSQAYFIDLLDVELYETLLLDIKKFDQLILLNPEKIIVIDEVQKIPQILDRVHFFIERHKRKFILTGSSARRLKQKGVNLLAGRALLNYLYPISLTELAFDFNLEKILQFGLLPNVLNLKSDEEKVEFLKAYVRLYVEKEVQLEGWVRKIGPFRKFLIIAAQMNGEIINRAAIAKQIAVDNMTIASYFEILEDTLLGFMLPAYHSSARKSLRQSPKFYFIDPGINRALLNLTSVPLTSRTQEFGQIFEQLIILEFKKLSEYFRLNFECFYCRSKNDVEIDLVVKRPGRPLLLIEIKSKNKVSESDVKSLENLGQDLDPKSKRILLSRDPQEQLYGGSRCLHYRDFFKNFTSLVK